MSTFSVSAADLPSRGTIKGCMALGLLASACTLGADIAADFWSPGFATPFHERLREHGEARLWIASLGNLFTMPLHLIGLFLIYLALRPAGAFWSLGPTALFAGLLMTYPQFIHSAWWFIGDAAACTDPGCAAVLARFEQRLRGVFGQFRISTIVGSIWLVIPILLGRTLLPRWVAAVPFVFVPAVIGFLLGLALKPVPSWLMHLLGGPFLLGILYAISGHYLLAAKSSVRG